MVRLLRDETLVTKWKTFFENGYKSQLETIATQYPANRSIQLDYIHVTKYDEELANHLLNNPYHTIFNAEQAIEDIETTSDFKLCLHVRPYNLTEAEYLPIRCKSANHIGKIRTIQGVIRKQTDVKAKPVVAAFQCQKCGAIIKVDQSEDILKEPTECYESDGGCGRVSTFKFLPSQSILVDCMKIQLQECTDDLTGQNQPKNLPVYLEDDLINTSVLIPGDRVSITGVLQIIPRYRGGRQLIASDFSFNALNLCVEETSFHTIDITKEDIENIIQNSKDPLIYDKLVQSMAPSICGLDLEKEAIILQLFGCQRLELPDGSIARGDIHILLVGDPGCAKSQLLRRASKISPKGIFTSGTSSTAAGLTAAAVHDEFSEGQWSLEAGALVIADMGLAAVDELDKMSDHDRNSLHTAMEQQFIAINKAGINTELPSRCSILAAANPKLGSFDEFVSLQEQINLPSTLMSRFDLVFTIIDRPNRKGDLEKAEHVLRSRQNTSYKPIQPCFSEEFIRKYVVYAKQNCNPVLSDEALQKLMDFYVSTRSCSDDSVTITIRQLESLIRLSTASARVRLSGVVTLDDAERAIRIYSCFIGRVGTDLETGKPDIQKIATGISHSQQDRMQKIYEIVGKLCHEEQLGTVDKGLIFRETDILGLPGDRVEDSLGRLVDQRMLFMVNGRYGVNKK